MGLIVFSYWPAPIVVRQPVLEDRWLGVDLIRQARVMPLLILLQSPANALRRQWEEQRRKDDQTAGGCSH
jgi:hypothetical protein